VGGGGGGGGEGGGGVGGGGGGGLISGIKKRLEMSHSSVDRNTFLIYWFLINL